MPKTVTLRLSDETYELLREAAEAQRRPLSNLIETAAVAGLLEEQFVDDAEMAEIAANESLLKRLARGAADAKKGRGRFVG